MCIKPARKRVWSSKRFYFFYSALWHLLVGWVLLVWFGSVFLKRNVSLNENSTETSYFIQCKKRGEKKEQKNVIILMRHQTENVVFSTTKNKTKDKAKLCLGMYVTSCHTCGKHLNCLLNIIAVKC